MNVSEALEKRKSVRAFTNKTVKQELLEQVLTSASHAPSGVNTQPWQVAVLSGSKKQLLQDKLLEAFAARQEKKMDYQYYPLSWSEPYKSRRRECGMQMYSALEIAREDKTKQIEQWAANYRAFDAPVMLLFYMDAELQTGSYLDYGMFLQSIMLAATEQGLATCPQAALVEYPEIVKDVLNLPSDSQMICGMALGYEDVDAAVNSYRTQRAGISEFVTFFST
ncbi:MAG: nitroreductase [gamma proteobacterium symbiont of Taylorina sp.]|nr:nitroreductase [gamma proteobacterium symbiont of Taylorina sp.]